MKRRTFSRSKRRTALKTTVFALFGLSAALLAAVIYQSLTAPAGNRDEISSVGSGIDETMHAALLPIDLISAALPEEAKPVVGEIRDGLNRRGAAGAPGEIPQLEGPVTIDDGLLPDGVTVFDLEYPGVGGLDSELLRALTAAASDAAGDGVTFFVTSGWRSAAYQDQLRQEAIVEYGSEAEAARWVASPERSAHVSGNAVDLGGVDATTWLAEHGAAYGLCQIYDNEPWHFELELDAIANGCAPTYADPTEDPRLQ